jgi:DNA-binding response OmpR family regulator
LLQEVNGAYSSHWSYGHNVLATFLRERKAKELARILVVDESPALRRLLRFMLKEHEIVEARFGLEALVSVAGGPFTLVISDAMLPDMDAEEMYRRLIDEGHSGSVLFLAARLDPPPRDRFGHRLPVLYKPVDAEELQARVDALLAQDAPQWDVK